MNKWVALAIISLAGVSLFSLYIASHIAQGIICSYVHLAPYLIPTSYVLGFFLGYALHQIQDRTKGDISDVFEGDKKIAVRVAVSGGLQSDIAKKIGKVRAHRTIRALENKGIIEKVKQGNTYVLRPGKKLEKLI